MIIRFWGVRGSIPTPLSPDDIRRKISAVVARITHQDIVSPESRERFLSHLPHSLFGTTGGNTTCVEVRLNDNTVIVFDAGTGISHFAQHAAMEQPQPKEYHLFFTHFHWDHIQGFPFFAPQAFDRSCTIHIYSPRADVEEILRNQMKEPYFPVTMDVMQAKIVFHHLKEHETRIGPAKIILRKMHHPGTSYSYKVQAGEGSFIFATDTELKPDDFARTEENRAFFSKVDILAIDSQYTLDEAIEKYDWGHSSYSLAVDFASEWSIKKLILFHHEPTYNDNKMHTILKSAGWYMSHVGKKKLNILLAQEGMELRI